MDTSCNRHRLTQSYKCCDRCSRFNVVVELPRLMAVVTSKHVRRGGSSRESTCTEGEQASALSLRVPRGAREVCDGVHCRCARRELHLREGAVGSLPMLNDAVGQNADYYGVTKKGRASPS
jgi:hypothetical protein